MKYQIAKLYVQTRRKVIIIHKLFSTVVTIGIETMKSKKIWLKEDSQAIHYELIYGKRTVRARTYRTMCMQNAPVQFVIRQINTNKNNFHDRLQERIINNIIISYQHTQCICIEKTLFSIRYIAEVGKGYFVFQHNGELNVCLIISHLSSNKT